MKSNFDGVFIAPTATVIGNVKIAPGSSVWFGAVLRSDMALIQIGRNTSVQDNAIIHVSEGVETIIGDQVTIGHGAIVHGAQVEDTVLIGIGAIVLDGAKVGTGVHHWCRRCGDRRNRNTRAEPRLRRSWQSC